MACLVAVILASSAPAGAQQPTQLAELSLEDLMNVKVETVVGASKYRQRVTDAPASVTIVTADEIQRQQYRSLADVLRSVRGFYVTYDRNYAYVGTRGFIRPGDYNSRILVLIDGHRLNDNIFGGALVGQEFPVDLSLVDRIEVIRGPGSALYGSAAMFGVINIITRQPATMSGTTATVVGGGQGTGGLTLTHARLPQHGTSFMASLALYRSSGATNLYYPEYADTPSGGFALGRDRTRRIDGLINASHGGFALQALYGLREKHVPTASFGGIFNDPDTKTLDGQGYVDLTYNRAFRDGAELSTRVFLDDYRYSGYLPYDIDGARVMNHDFARGVWWGGEARWSKTLFRQHRVTGGFEFRDSLRQFQHNYDVAPAVEYLRDSRDLGLWSLYAKDEWHLHERITVDLGLRSDAYSQFSTSVKPRIGVIVSPAKLTTVKVLYGQAFRAPTVYELYWRQSDVTKSNPDLTHEEMSNTELVLEQYVGSQWRLSANAFRYRLRDLVDQFEDVDGLLVYRNRGAVNGSGVELELEGHWANGLLVRASQTVQRSTNALTDDGLSNSPRGLFQAGVTVPIARSGLSASLNLQSMSHRLALDGSDVPAYTIANLSLMAPRLRRNVEFGASLWNLFNTRFGDPGSEEHQQRVIPQDGRVLGVQARVRF